MKTVGLSFGSHDTAYATFDGMDLIIHEELERHSRIKECDGDALDFYKARQGSLDGVDTLAHFPHGDFKHYPANWKELEAASARGELELIEVGHHCAHAANAFYSSRFDEALIITLDGGGWDRVQGELKASSFTAWVGSGTKINPIKYSWDFNIGVSWQRLTSQVFGLSGGGPPVGCQAGSVMAMAALGDSRNFMDLDYSIFNHSFSFSKYSTLEEQARYDLAARVQELTELKVREEISNLLKDNPSKFLCLSGGVFLNSVLSGKITNWFKLDGVYIPPVPYDSGLSIGCGQYVLHHIHDYPRVEWDDCASSYLGRSYEYDDIKSSLESSGVSYKEFVSDDDVLELLDGQKIVSVFGGRSESGRRALGNRSILADPRNATMKDLINEKVKHRQWFRPFAPSILRERVSDWFIKDIDSPYMSYVVPFKDDMKNKVPAVVHFDGTARLQTVTEKQNEWYWNFLNKWEKRSGVPILLNTSFNDREPIVETPSDAISCFSRTDIDYLYFYNCGILAWKA